MGKRHKPEKIIAKQRSLIPTCIDHNSRAHLRRPIVMMRHGWSMRSYEEVNSERHFARLLSLKTHSGD